MSGQHQVCLGKFAYGHVPDMTTMEACHRASDRQRLQLLKQKHPSRQDDWGGEPAVMDGEWLWKETFLT